MNYININGKIIAAGEAGMPVDNGAFRYGHGLFETMLVRDGAIQLAAYHWQRLFDGMKRLYLEPPPLMTADWLQDQVLRVVRRNSADKLCRVRLQVFAGGGGLYGDESARPGFVIECFPLEADNMMLNQNGMVAGIATGLAKSPDTLSDLKSCDALIYAIAAKRAKENKWNDALVLNTNGEVIESTIANIFWVKDGSIYTPPLADGCVAGVMRRHVTTVTSVSEQSLTIDTLLRADEVWLTNAIKKLRWVGAIADSVYGHSLAADIYATL